MDALNLTLQKLEEMVQGFFWILPNLVVALAVFLIFALTGALVRRAVLRVAFARGRRDFGLLLGGFARWAVLLFGLLWVAAIVFPSVKPADVLATLGVGSVAVGFAFKDILQNWLSGLLILYRRPFRQGDQIRSGEFEGTVEHIEARATLLRTYDGQRVVIPNADIYTRSVTVRTAFPLSRSEYDVGVGYGDDPERACRVILDALRGTEGIARDPAPEAYPWSFDPSSVAIKVFWWSDARRAEQIAARGRAIAALKQGLAKAGVDLPFPTQVMLFHDQTEDTDGDRTRQREGWPAGERPSSPRPSGLRDPGRDVREARPKGSADSPPERAAQEPR